MTRDPHAPGGDWRLEGPLLLITLFVLVAVAGAMRYAPPPPRPAGAAPDAFSAAAAMEVLHELVGEGLPHPVGSSHNQVVRERVGAALRRAGYEVRIQEAIVPAGPRAGLPLANVMARRSGFDSTGTVVLAAHHDSVPAGPGAADDGAAVAVIIEIARMLAAMPPRRNDVLLLLTDGEEAGMLGARAFVEAHGPLREPTVVVNLEARGTSGVSLLFEVSDGGGWLVDEFAAHARRKVINSLFPEIYRRMPHDSDFTIFRRHGMQGVNFAFIGAAQNYHTSDDRLENVDAGSVQHHGDNAWALALALSERDLERHEEGDSIAFDLFAWAVVRWPQHLSIVPALSSALLVLASIAILVRRRIVSGADLATSLGCLLLLPALAVAAACALDATLRAGGALPHRWPQRATIVVTSLWLAAACAASLVVWIGPARAAVWRWWAATWLAWAALAIAVALGLPGGSYLLVVPALLAGLTGVPAVMLAAAGRQRGALVTSVVGAAAAACVWLPLERLFHDGLGFGPAADLFTAGRAALLMTAAAPVLAAAGRKGRRLVCGVLAGAGLITGGLAFLGL